MQREEKVILKQAWVEKAIKLMLAGTLNSLGYKGSLKDLKIEFSLEEEH